MKNLIKNKSTKKATKNNNNFITPSYITRAGSLLNGVVDGGMAKQGFYDTESSIPNFYTPELTPDTWLLPRSRAEILRWPLLEGEKVWCNGKFVNIEDIKIGDKVLASNGKEQTVLNTMSKEADDVGVEIITRFAPPVQFGGNHPIWAVDTNKSTEYVSKCFRTCLYNNAISFDTVAKWYDAKDVKPGFMVKIPKYKIEKDIQIDLVDYLPEETSHGYRFNVLEDTINYKLGQTDLTISRHLPLNNEVFEFLGWYIAEGHIHRNSILLTLAYDELLIAKHLKEVLLSNFNIEEETINIFDHNGSYRLSINNPVLASFILKNFNTGSKDKFIPQWLLDSKKELIISFLRGWIKGDGKITDEALEDQTSGFSLTTTSEQLSKMGYMLFNKVGCIVGVKEEHQTLAEAQKKAGFKYTIQSCAPVVYYLTANGNRVKNIFPELTYTEKVCPNFYEDEDYYYTTVKSVKIFETTKRFHCVTTEDHTICVPYITHNCRLFFNLDPYINSILTMHAQYPICNFRLSYKDKDTEEFFNRKLFFNKEFSWIDFLEQLMLSYLKLGEACLTGDTRIKLLDGTSKTLEELYNSKAENFYVYSVDEKGNIVPGKADSVVLTRKNAEILKVTLDNGEYFKCTPDHKIMLRDGSYKEAQDLKEGDALMPLKSNKNHKVAKIEPCGFEDVFDIHSSGEYHNFAIETGEGSGIFVHNCVWGDFSEANGTWTNFTLIDPALINYKEDPMSGDVEMSIIPTRELKEMIADALKQGRQDVPIEYIKCVQENHEIPLDASEVEANYLTGRKYSPARVFMMARRTDPASTRGVPMIQSCFKTLIYSDKIKLAQIACASGDTKVRLLDGQVKTMEELYKSNEKDFWVYSCTEKGEIVYKKASKVICNGKKQLYKIKLDNGDYLRFTADHPFLMRDGSWKEVKDLKPGDSLMPLYLRERKIGFSMYDQVYSPIEDKWEFVHRLIPLTGKFKGCVIHHKNFKGKDNRPENLVPMSVEEHSHMHRDLTIKRQPELQKAVQKYRETEQYKKDLIRNGKIISKVRTEQEKEKYKKGVRYKLLTSLPECGYKVIDYLDKNQTAKKNFERVANAFGLDIKVRSFFGKLLIYKTSVINNSDFKRVLRDLSYDLQHRTAVKDQISTEYKDFLRKYTLLKNKEVDYLIIPISNYSSIHSLRSTISRYIKQDGFSSIIKTSELRGYNCIIVYNSYAQEIINRTKTESRVFANNQKKGIVDIWNHKVVSVEKDVIENVYDIESVDDTHTFGVVTSDGSGVFVHNCADRLHLPIEIWSVGQYTGDPNTSIIPDDTMLANVREAIREATMQPPFSIFVPPYIKYEAVGVNGKLLSVYEDLGYVENCIFVALGVNKNLILGQGPSFSSSKQTSLFKLIKMYKMMRLKLEAFIKRYIILPIAKANDIKDEYGEYVVPEIEWEESLQPEQDVEMFNNVLKLWDKGLVSTMTLYEYFPGQLDINLEKKRMEEEKRSVFDKGTDRLGAKSLREDLKEDSPESKSTPKPSDGKGPAKDMPSPISGGEALEGLEKGEEATPSEGGAEPTPPTPPEGLEGE